MTKHELSFKYVYFFFALLSKQKPAEVLKRKKVSGVWFPYTTVERLWWALEKTMNSGRMLEQCQKLKGQLQQALLNHLKLVHLQLTIIGLWELKAISCGSDQFKECLFFWLVCFVAAEGGLG